MPQKPWGTDEQVKLLQSLIPDYLQSKPTNNQADFFYQARYSLVRLMARRGSVQDSAPRFGRCLDQGPVRRTGVGTVPKHKTNSVVVSQQPRYRRDSGGEEILGPEHAQKDAWTAKNTTPGPPLARIPDNAGEVVWASMDGEEPDENVKCKACNQASTRIAVRREVTMQLLAQETEEVKSKIDELIATAAEKMPSATEEECTPESVQMSLDELNDIVARFHVMLEKTMGWFGLSCMEERCPMQEALRPLVCQTFRDLHPTWKTDMSAKFHSFVARCFTPYVQQDKMCPSVDGLWQFPTPPNGDASNSWSQHIMSSTGAVSRVPPLGSTPTPSTPFAGRRNTSRSPSLYATRASVIHEPEEIRTSPFPRSDWPLLTSRGIDSAVVESRTSPSLRLNCPCLTCRQLQQCSRDWPLLTSRGIDSAVAKSHTSPSLRPNCPCLSRRGLQQHSHQRGSTRLDTAVCAPQ
ncbi:hypothetical protein K438DRAFT_1782482 [Mycena galopus ATCC 62051]|nr:hypothetical protein K438DRAFT_1782482 [Mycena galopus ATCC 62051]